ncbi:MAG: cysteine hydrolase [Candidatus Binatia bacterium]
MNVNELERRKTGLLFFDMLNIYYHGAETEKKEGMRPVIANAVRLRDAARKSSIPIFYAQANHRPDGATNNRVITDTDMRLRPWPHTQFVPKPPAATAGSWEAAIIEELKPEPQDTVIPKYRWSAFFQTYLDLALRARGINTVIISGGSTEIGVASTVYSARDMDYHIIIARDACSGSQMDAYTVLMDKVFPRMARVRTTDRVLEMIRNGR